MSATDRKVIEEYRMGDYLALEYETEAVQLYWTKHPAAAQPTGRYKANPIPGLHIATITKTNSSLKKQGWLATLLLGIIELFEAPQSITPQKTRGEEGRFLIDYNELKDNEQVAAVMAYEGFTQAEKAAAVCSVVSHSVPLTGEGLKEFFRNNWRLKDFGSQSIPWGKNYASFLMPAMGVHLKTSSVTLQPMRFDNEDSFTLYFKLLHFLAQGGDKTLEEFKKETQFEFNSKTEIDESVLTLLHQRLKTIGSTKKLNDFTPEMLIRFFSHFSQVDTSLVKDWQLARLRSGVVLHNELHESYHYDPFPNAGYMLTSEEFSSLTTYLQEHPASPLHNFGATDGKLRSVILVLIVELGIERVDSILSEAVKGEGLRAAREWAWSMKGKDKLEMLLQLTDPVLSDVPPVFVMALVGLEG